MSRILICHSFCLMKYRHLKKCPPFFTRTYIDILRQCALPMDIIYILGLNANLVSMLQLSESDIHVKKISATK